MAALSSFAGELFNGLLFNGSLFQSPGPVPPPVDVAATNCLIGRLVTSLYLNGSLPHARDCERDAVAISAVRQNVEEPAHGQPRWTVTVPYTELTNTGMTGYSLPTLNIARRLGEPPIFTTGGGFTNYGDPPTQQDAVFEFDWDTEDPSFTNLSLNPPELGFSDDYRYSIFLTDTDGRLVLIAQGILTALNVVHA